CDVRRDAVLDVGAAVILLIALEVWGRDVFRQRVRRNLQAAGRLESVQPNQVAELRWKAAHRRAVQRPTDALPPVPVHVSPDSKAERVARRMRVAELGQRDPEFSSPAERIDPRRDLPDGVPGLVLLLSVTVDGVVALHAGGVHRELKAGAAVVVGVDRDLDLVTADAGITACEELLYAVRMRVEGAHEHGEGACVVSEPSLRRPSR